MDPDKLLAIYMNDHVGGAALGSSLARRIEKHHEGRAREVAGQVAREIEEDRQTLQQLMERLDVREKRFRQLAARAMERLSRVKPNGAVVRRSPLSRLEELETMTIGVTGKLELWRALAVLAEQDPRLDKEEIEGLAQRAQSQIDRLEQLRLDAAREAFVVGETRHQGDDEREPVPSA